MTELEKRIQKELGLLAPTSKTATALAGIKKVLNSSSHIVDAVNDFGDNLQDNIEDSVGGFTGTIGGWMAGKTTKIVGGIAGGVVSGTLKTVAGVIPDSSDIKQPESDRKVAHCIDSYSIPSDKNELFELLQFVWNSTNSKNTPYGKQTIESFKNLHSRVQAAFQIAASEDNNLQQLAKPYYMPKKKFGFL